MVSLIFYYLCSSSFWNYSDSAWFFYASFIALRVLLESWFFFSFFSTLYPGSLSSPPAESSSSSDDVVSLFSSSEVDSSPSKNPFSPPVAFYWLNLSIMFSSTISSMSFMFKNSISSWAFRLYLWKVKASTITSGVEWLAFPLCPPSKILFILHF